MPGSFVPASMNLQNRNKSHHFFLPSSTSNSMHVIAHSAGLNCPSFDGQECVFAALYFLHRNLAGISLLACICALAFASVQKKGG